MATKRSKVIILPARGYAPIIKYGKHLALTNSGKLGGCVQHLYLTIDEEIKVGNYIIDDNGVFGPWEAGDVMIGKHKGVIVSTTDESLGLPQPTKSFVEAYVKAGGIDEVMIEYEEYDNGMSALDISDDYPYKYPTRIKVDSHNTITIHPIKNSWNLEELTVLLERCTYDNTGIKLKHVHMEVKNWIKQNVN